MDYLNTLANCTRQPGHCPQCQSIYRLALFGHEKVVKEPLGNPDDGYLNKNRQTLASFGYGGVFISVDASLCYEVKHMLRIS